MEPRKKAPEQLSAWKTTPFLYSGFFKRFSVVQKKFGRKKKIETKPPNVHIYVHPFTLKFRNTPSVFEAICPWHAGLYETQVAALEDGRQRSATALQAIPFEKVREIYD